MAEATPAPGNRTVSDIPSKGHLMLGLIVSLIIIGLIAGAIARLLVPGKQHLSIMMTIVLGIVGRSSAASWAT